MAPVLHRIVRIARAVTMSLVLGLLAVSSFSGSGAAQQQLVELPVAFHMQNTPVWCWAATISMVVDHTQRFRMEDCQALAEYDMRLGGRGLCCTPAFATCTRTGGIGEMAVILGEIFGIQGRYFDRPPAYPEIVAQINAGKPMIAALVSRLGGHVVVVSGYGPGGNVVILDPAAGRAVVPYPVLLASWQHGIWAGTFVIDSARATEPMCRLVPEVITVQSMCPGPFGPAPCLQQIVRPRIVCRKNTTR